MGAGEGCRQMRWIRLWWEVERPERRRAVLPAAFPDPSMRLAYLLPGIFLLAFVLLDAFQTIILPRRPVGRFRITSLFFMLTWFPWTVLVRLSPSRRGREQMYSIYGPLALLLLFVVWASLLTVAYGFIYFGLGVTLIDPHHPIPMTMLQHLRSCLYFSGTTIFTLGMGDVQPMNEIARTLTVIEAGTGFGFFALVVGYVPVLYTAFSNREVSVALLDGRAGSPPTAGGLLMRHNFAGGHAALTTLLGEWERWSATMLETHISYPILCYYRSQHDNQSWLAAVTAILDTCALLITTIEGPSTRQAQLTFAVARHTLVDLGHVFQLEAAIAKAATGWRRFASSTSRTRMRWPNTYGWSCHAGLRQQAHISLTTGRRWRSCARQPRWQTGLRAL
jgi:hypothetical protein